MQPGRQPTTAPHVCAGSQQEWRSEGGGSSPTQHEAGEMRCAHTTLAAGSGVLFHDISRALYEFYCASRVILLFLFFFLRWCSSPPNTALARIIRARHTPAPPTRHATPHTPGTHHAPHGARGTAPSVGGGGILGDGDGDRSADGARRPARGSSFEVWGFSLVFSGTITTVTPAPLLSQRRSPWRREAAIPIPLQPSRIRPLSTQGRPRLRPRVSLCIYL